MVRCNFSNRFVDFEPTGRFYFFRNKKRLSTCLIVTRDPSKVYTPSEHLLETGLDWTGSFKRWACLKITDICTDYKDGVRGPAQAPLGRVQGVLLVLEPIVDLKFLPFNCWEGLEVKDRIPEACTPSK